MIAISEKKTLFAIIELFKEKKQLSAVVKKTINNNIYVYTHTHIK